MLAGSKVGEKLHVVDVHAAVEVSEAIWRGVAVMIGPGGEGRPGQREAGSGGGAQELAARGKGRRTLRADAVLSAVGGLAPLLRGVAGAHRIKAPGSPDQQK